MIGSRGRVSFARAVALSSTAVVAAGGLVVLAPGIASAAPSGGITLQTHCNQYTGTQDSTIWTDAFSGLVGNSSAGYRVKITFTDSSGPNSTTDDVYWFAEGDGSYNHVYTEHFTLAEGAGFTWSLDDFVGGTEYDGILTGSGAVSGSGCAGIPQKPSAPELEALGLHPADNGVLDVPLGVDPNTGGTVHILQGAVNLGTGTYSSHDASSHDASSVDVSVPLSAATMKQLWQVRLESVTVTATSQNSASLQSTSSTAASLEAPLMPDQPVFAKKAPKIKVSKTGAFTFTFQADPGIAGDYTIKHGSTKLRSSDFGAAKSGKVTVKAKLKKSALAHLKKVKSEKVTITAVVSKDNGTHTATSSETATLKAPKKK